MAYRVHCLPHSAEKNAAIRGSKVVEVAMIQKRPPAMQQGANPGQRTEEVGFRSSPDGCRSIGLSKLIVPSAKLRSRSRGLSAEATALLFHFWVGDLQTVTGIVTTDQKAIKQATGIASGVKRAIRELEQAGLIEVDHTMRFGLLSGWTEWLPLSKHIVQEFAYEAATLPHVPLARQPLDHPLVQKACRGVNARLQKLGQHELAEIFRKNLEKAKNEGGTNTPNKPPESLVTRDKSATNGTSEGGNGCAVGHLYKRDTKKKKMSLKTHRRRRVATPVSNSPTSVEDQCTQRAEPAGGQGSGSEHGAATSEPQASEQSHSSEQSQGAEQYQGKAKPNAFRRMWGAVCRAIGWRYDPARKRDPAVVSMCKRIARVAAILARMRYTVESVIGLCRYLWARYGFRPKTPEGLLKWAKKMLRPHEGVVLKALLDGEHTLDPEEKAVYEQIKREDERKRQEWERLFERAFGRMQASGQPAPEPEQTAKPEQASAELPQKPTRDERQSKPEQPARQEQSTERRQRYNPLAELQRLAREMKAKLRGEPVQEQDKQPSPEQDTQPEVQQDTEPERPQGEERTQTTRPFDPLAELSRVAREWRGKMRAANRSRKEVEEEANERRRRFEELLRARRQMSA